MLQTQDNTIQTTTEIEIHENYQQNSDKILHRQTILITLYSRTTYMNKN